MLVLLYSLEELSDYHCYGYNGSIIAPFNGSEKRFSDLVYRYWFGSDIVKREIYKSILQRNYKVKSGLNFEYQIQSTQKAGRLIRTLWFLSIVISFEQQPEL